MRYNIFVERLEDLVEKGLSAAVYTQTTDAEGEVNGFMAYDRKVLQKIFYLITKRNQYETHENSENFIFIILLAANICSG